MSKIKKHDDFGNRMKEFESVETYRQFDVRFPVCARIDGRSFSRFTRGMDRPYDIGMSIAMRKTTAFLVEKTHARLGYTQSDEISLTWLAEGERADIFFSGKVQKMVSVLASMAAAKFASVCPPGFEDRLPHFDCRAFQVPNRLEAANVFLWRALDARKNAISMAAQSVYSPKQLHGKSQRDMLVMLADKDIDFNEYPGFFKNGTFARRKTADRFLTPDELDRIPKAHHPTGPVMRSFIELRDDIFMKDIEDRESFIFEDSKNIIG